LSTLLYISGCIAVIASLMVITRTNAIHALLYLIVSLLSVALIFFILGAPFVAALEVIIHAGAIMVLFIFAVMMLNVTKEAADQERQWLRPAGCVGPSFLCAVLLGELIYVLSQGSAKNIDVAMISPKQVGLSLFGPYLLGVELASILLLSGLIGAFYIGRREESENKAGGGGS